MSDPYSRLQDLGYLLPPPPSPVGSYVTHVLAERTLYLSGQGPRQADGTTARGKLGRDLDVPQGYQQARLAGLNLLAIMHAALGDLGRVHRVIKLLGMVNAVPEFEDHPAVINGCSDLFVAVFGENGRHARSAVGFGSLPGGIPVEIEAIVEVAP